MAKINGKSLQPLWRAAAVAASLGLGAAQAATFVPSSGRLLVVGQDTTSIANYVSAMGASETPGGVTAYIDMNLGGLTSMVDNNAGPNNVAQLASTYPNSALAVAVYAVNQLGAINSGSFDANIDTMINTLKAHNRPVYLRFGYEFDGPWNAYDPAAFKSAWIRIYNRIVALGAQNNIAMVWQSSSWCNSGGAVERFGGNALDAWYPGDQYVDLVAVSYFTPTAASALKGGTCTVGNEAIDAVATFASNHSKPLMIAEATPQGYHIGNLTWRDTNGNNLTAPAPVTAAQIQTWYTDFFNWVAAKNVKVVAYINADWNSQLMWSANPNTGVYEAGYWGDSRVQANTTIKNDWISKVSSGYLKASSTLFSSLGYGAAADTTAPTLPGSVTVGSATSNSLKVSWTASTDAVGVTAYEVFRGTSSLGTTTALNFTDSGLTASTSYSYQVRARDAAGNWSAKTTAKSGTTTAASSDTTAPTVPGGVTVGSATSNSLTVSWTASSDAVGVTGYEVFRGSTSLGTKTGLSFTDTGLAASTSYSYQIRARDAAGNWSAKTTAKSGTTTAASSTAKFGIDSAGKFYHVQGTQTGTWHYLCLNSDCRAGTLVSGRYERAVTVTAGTSYTIEFKVQDNTAGQCLSGVSTVTYASAGVTATSACAP